MNNSKAREHYLNLCTKHGSHAKRLHDSWWLSRKYTRKDVFQWADCTCGYPSERDSHVAFCPNAAEFGTPVS